MSMNVFTQYNKQHQLRNYTIRIIICGLLLIASIYTWKRLKQSEQEHIIDNVQAATEMFVAAVNHDLIIHAEPLQNIAKLWELGDGLPKKQWNIVAKSFTENYSGYAAIEWIDSKYLVRWVVPLRGNTKVVNMQIKFGDKRKNAINTMLRERKPIFSNIINLVQGGKGFLYYVPLQRRDGKFDGFMIGVFRLDRFIKNLFALHQYDDFNINIYDKSGKQILLDKNNEKVVSKYAYASKYNNPLISWKIELVPSEHYIKQHQSNFPFVVLLAGISSSLAIFIILSLLDIARFRAIKIRNHARQLDMTYRSIAILAETNHFDQAVRSILKFICTTAKWSVGHAYILSPDQNKVTSSGLWYIEPSERLTLRNFVNATKKMEFPRGTGMPGRVWETKEPVWVYDLHENNNSLRINLCPEVDLHSAFAFPVFNQAGELVLILEFFSHDYIHQSDVLINYLKTLSLQLGSSVSRLTMEDKVRISEMKYRSVIEGALNAIIMMDYQGKILECNQATDDLFGRNELELIGEKFSSLLSSPYNYEIDAYIETFLNTGTKSPIGEGKEVTVSDKNDNQVPIIITMSEIELEGDVYFIAMLQDVSSLRHTETALKSSQAREQILKYVADGLYGVDMLGRVTYANPAALNMLGYREEEVLGKDMHELVHYQYSDGKRYMIEECELNKAILQGRSYQAHDVTFWRKDKTMIKVDYESTPMRKDGKLIGSAVVIKLAVKDSEANKKSD